MRKLSSKRRKIQDTMASVYIDIDKGEPCCYICGMAAYDHSHNFPRTFVSVIANPLNITPLCRTHHKDWEDARLGYMGERSIDIVRNCIRLIQEQGSEHVAKDMLSYLSSKIIKSHYKSPDELWLKELYDSL